MTSGSTLLSFTGTVCLNRAIGRAVYQDFTANINKGKPCMICFFKIIQSPVISDHSVFCSFSPKGSHIHRMERKKN